MARLVVVEIFVADGARRHEAVGAGLVQLHEQAGAGDAGDAAVEGGADAVGEEMRDQPVVGLALGHHGAPLGGGNFRGNLGKPLVIGGLGQGAVAELERADQPAMHDQIGVAADRRGEMRVAAQVEAEVAVVLGGIFGLRLAAQHDFVDELLVVAALHLLEDAVEGFRLEHAAFGERNVERGEEFVQRGDLLLRRLVMHAVDQRHARFFQRLGGGDIGEDHELLDQPMRFQPLGADDAIDGAVGLEQDLALGQIEIERLTLIARARQRFVGGIERL